MHSLVLQYFCNAFEYFAYIGFDLSLPKSAIILHIFRQYVYRKEKTMLQKEYEQTKKEFSSVEQNIWIQEYVSRRENPIILALYILAVSIGSLIVFTKYFTTGSAYSLWFHIGVLIAFLIVFIIIHSILNSIFRKKAMKLCPVEASPYDAEMPSDITAQLAEEDAMLAEYERLKKLDYKGFDVAPYVFLTPIVFILAFGYFAWIQQSPIPQGCVLYLVVMCVALTIYSAVLFALSSQLLDVPLSYKVKESLERTQKSHIKQQEKAHTSSNESSDVSWYIHQQKEREDYERRLHEWATSDDDPTPGCGDGI